MRFAKGSKAEALFLTHLTFCSALAWGPEEAMRLVREGKGERTVARGIALIDRAIVKASREMRGA